MGAGSVLWERVADVFGLRVGRVRGENSGVGMPDGTVILFRHGRRPKRGDIVLVDHPELGRIVRKVSVVGRRGSVNLKGMSSRTEGGQGKGRVEPDAVLGVMVCKLTKYLSRQA